MRRSLVIILTFLVVGLTATRIAAQPDSTPSRQFTLYVREGTLATANGEQLYVWGFTDDPNGPPQMPGPAIVVNEGDRVEITLINDRDPTASDRLPFGEGHTIHLHGLDVPTEHDGVPETHPSGLVRQGGAFTYRFTATHAGTYFYHCHQNNVEHQQMGMYGPLIVRAAGGARAAYTNGPRVDREYTVTLADAGIGAHELARAATKNGAPPYNWLNYRPSHYILNDRIIPTSVDPTLAVSIASGEQTLVRVINAGYAAQEVHAHEEPFTIVATDGRPWPAGPEATAVWVTPGEKYDLLFRPGAARTLTLHSHTGVEPKSAGLFTSVPPAPAPDTGEVRRVTRYVRDGQKTLPDGVSIPVRGYASEPGGAGLVPGPIINANAGDTLEITLVNDPAGQVAGFQVWGGATLAGPASVPPGGTGIYQLRAEAAGALLYGDPALRHLGLYGGVVISPNDGANVAYPSGPGFDQQYTMVLSELDQAIQERITAGILDPSQPGTDYRPNYFLINGLAYPDTESNPESFVRAQPGERILVRLINAGQIPHAMHLHGYHFAVVSRGTQPLVSPPLKDTLLVGPEESFLIWFVADQEGLYPFHDHYETANTNNGVWLGGMHTLVATGAAATMPHATPTAGPAASPDGPTVALRDNFYTPNQVTIPVGATVRWEHQGRVEHTVSSLLGYFDSGTVRAGDTYSFTFTAPGRYDYFCRFHITNRGVVIVQ